MFSEAIRIVYAANILVAGWISITSLFFPKVAHRSVFEQNVEYSGVIQLVGALWFAIFLLSVLGMFFPQKMSLVLVFQLIYKSSWLLVVALPALIRGNAFPSGMAVVFLIWVLLLPLFIPWRVLFSSVG
jgi:hypothetical protein